MSPEEIASLIAIRDKIIDKVRTTGGISRQAHDGLNNLGRYMKECSQKNARVPSMKRAIDVLPKDSVIRQATIQSRFNTEEKILYKYIDRKYSADLIEHNLLYCNTISYCRDGPWGDPEETIFEDLSDFFDMAYSGSDFFQDDILGRIGMTDFNLEASFKQLLDAIGEKRICCVSKSPYIKEMWEWKGNANALCVPIRVDGLDFYKIEYSDEKINPFPYLFRTFNLIYDALNGKVSRRAVQSLFDDSIALSYLSICKKKTKRDDGIKWDVQQEYRMFPEKLLSHNGKYDCYVDLTDRVCKPITYNEFLNHYSTSQSRYSNISCRSVNKNAKQ